MPFPIKPHEGRQIIYLRQEASMRACFAWTIYSQQTDYNKKKWFLETVRTIDFSEFNYIGLRFMTCNLHGHSKSYLILTADG